MAKSRKRGGAKAHRKRVQQRNQRIGIQQKKIKKMFSDMYETRMKELQESFKQMSGLTSNEENQEISNPSNEEQSIKEETQISSSESSNEQSN